MEGGEKVEASTSDGGAPASSRWNPTKEQISMLENLYRQGIRTPSAEQIQQITSRLKAYGHIEGKNVFYWFQNHKARQRQKLKQQDNNPYFTRFLHKTSPLFPPTSSNVVCSPYCLQQSDIGYYPHQYPKLLLPGGIKRRSARADKMDKVAKAYGGLGNYEQHNTTTSTIQTRDDIDGEAVLMNNNMYTTNSNVNDQQTLDLFPLQPSGGLHATAAPTTTHSTPSTSSQYTHTHTHTNAIEEASRDQPFFDFFSADGPSISE